MPSKSQKFRVRLTKFFQMLEASFPEDKELKHYGDKLIFGLDSNPSSVIRLIMSHIEPYATHIIKGDDSYLVNADTSHLENSDDWTSILSKLQNLWLEMSDRFKEIVRNNLLILLILGTQVTRNRELLSLINSNRSPDNQLGFD